MIRTHLAFLGLGITLGACISWHIADALHRPADVPASYTSQDRRDLAGLVRAIQREARKDPQFRKPR